MPCPKLFLVLICLLELGGCASQRVVSPLPDGLWQDQEFSYQPTLVTETRDTLFALDEAVVQSLRADNSAYPVRQRLDLLVSRLYGPKGIRLSYASGHSTGATQTLHNQRGDCLSLTILAYAAAKYLGLDAHMQEVRVPAAVDRRDGVDFINGHVNVIVRNASEVSINGQMFATGTFVLDFEPQAGTRRSGVWLTPDAILARFYNNKATEYWVQKDDVRAYAYYRAAIASAPDYAPAYANLAQLYARHQLVAGAERLLLHAIALGGPSYAPLRAMQQLLLAQDRGEEAQHYAQLLAQRQEEDPYHWLGLGLVALRDGRPAAAIPALERAAALTTGFEEIHYYLGLAYWRSGQWEAARQQLAALRAINNRDPGIAVLSKKLQSNAPQSAVF